MNFQLFILMIIYFFYILQFGIVCYQVNLRKPSFVLIMAHHAMELAVVKIMFENYIFDLGSAAPHHNLFKLKIIISAIEVCTL